MPGAIEDETENERENEREDESCMKHYDCRGHHSPHSLEQHKKRLGEMIEDL